MLVGKIQNHYYAITITQLQNEKNCQIVGNCLTNYVICKCTLFPTTSTKQRAYFLKESGKIHYSTTKTLKNTRCITSKQK